MIKERDAKKQPIIRSFDVTMSSLDKAETCELVGSYLLSKINQQHRKQQKTAWEHFENFHEKSKISKKIR